MLTIRADKVEVVAGGNGEVPKMCAPTAVDVKD